MAKNLVVICTAWGFEEGGVNSFNYDFCNAFYSQMPTELWKVFVIAVKSTADHLTEYHYTVLQPDSSKEDLPKKISLENINEAQLENVILKLQKRDTVIIGHDVFSGGFAINLSRLLHKRYIRAVSVVFHHMDYSSYSISTSLLEKIADQKKILKEADVVFGIGPKLMQSAQKLRGKKDAYMFVPGLYPSPSIISTKQKIGSLSKFTGITYGRVEAKDDYLKQYSLAVAAFGTALNQSSEDLFHKDSRLRVAGVVGSRDWLEKIAAQSCDRYSYCAFLDYANRDQIFTALLDDVHISMMLSVHEGFGLSALESIAAEIPIILGKNSGIYQLLENLLRSQVDANICAIDIKGSRNGEPHPVDLSAVTEAIIGVRKDFLNYQKKISLVKKKFHRKYNWERSVSNFVKIVEEEFFKDDYLRTYRNKRSNMECLTQCENSKQFFIKGDIASAYAAAENAIRHDKTCSLALLRFVRAGIRLGKVDELRVMIKNKSFKKDDDYNEALMHYERSINQDYKKVLKHFNCIKNKKTQHYYDAGMCFFYQSLILKEKGDSNYKQLLGHSLTQLKKAKQNSMNSYHWWVDVMMLLIYRLLPDDIEVADWQTSPIGALNQLNDHIAKFPLKTSARIYRFLLGIIMEDNDLIKICMSEDKSVIEANQNIFLPNDLIDSLSNRISYLFKNDDNKRLKYNELIEKYISLYYSTV